jgi:hypothetical protein
MALEKCGNGTEGGPEQLYIIITLDKKSMKFIVIPTNHFSECKITSIETIEQRKQGYILTCPKNLEFIAYDPNDKKTTYNFYRFKVDGGELKLFKAEKKPLENEERYIVDIHLFEDRKLYFNSQEESYL